MNRKRYYRRRRRHSAHRQEKGALTRNPAGKIIVLIQLLLTAVCIGVVWNSGLVPGKYLAAAAAGLLVLFAVCFGLQFLKSRIHVAGIILSVIISVLLGFGIYYLAAANRMLADVGGATYKTDNMVVVVRKDDPAEHILDTENYRYGIQTSLDQENNEKMLADIENALGRRPHLTEFGTVQEEAHALLGGQIEAAVYNEAFTGIIEDEIEGYSDQVRILYHYGIRTEIAQEEKSVDDAFNIYISGIDVAGDISTNSRSDVNIIMTVNPNTHRILLTTTPRDYYVAIPDISGGQRDKLTHAGIYGVDRSMATLETIYGIDIAYYARVNFTSLIRIVDALGGVDVYSEYAFESRGHQFQQGYNHMDGEAALAFARERYSFESGDNQRGRNQEAVLTAIIQKAMSPALLMNASELISSVSDCVETNMTQEEMAHFINLQLSEGAQWQIESTAATGRGDNQACFSSGQQLLYVMWPDETSVAQISSKMKQVLAGE